MANILTKDGLNDEDFREGQLEAIVVLLHELGLRQERFNGYPIPYPVWRKNIVSMFKAGARSEDFLAGADSVLEALEQRDRKHEIEAKMGTAMFVGATRPLYDEKP